VSALELPDQSNRDPMDKLVSYLQDRHMMIVLDNCEHLLAACAFMAETLFRGSPGLRILATSREPLRIGGESICAVPPLTKPSTDECHTAKAIVHYEAVSVLIDRARSVLPEFEVIDENDRDVVDCLTADGSVLWLKPDALNHRRLIQRSPGLYIRICASDAIVIV
jgi:predicted ATPase